MELTGEIVRILSDGRFHSGQALAVHFNVTRAAIWKSIKKLVQQGFAINAITGRGYQLSDKIELLDNALIKQHLVPSTVSKLGEILVFDQLPSTNDYLHEISAEKGTVCLAERQTKAKGRLGRSWLSPYAKNIALSLAWSIKTDSHSLSGLSLVIGIAVIDALRELGFEDVGIKWPNDLMHGQKKLGGILIEMRGEVGSDFEIIIGLGLNVKHAPDLNRIDQAVTSLDKVQPIPCSRNALAGALLNNMVNALTLFESKGLDVFLEKWNVYDLLKNKSVSVKTGQTYKHGVAMGINPAGLLNVQFDNETLTFHSAEVTVREW